MSDRRLTPANGRVAAAHLRGLVEAEHFSEGRRATIRPSVANLLESPGGRRERQLLHGAEVVEYEDVDGWSFVQSLADGYVGYLRSDMVNDDLADEPAMAATHRVVTRATHAYRQPDIKSREALWLSLGARVEVTGRDETFLHTTSGYVPARHLAPLEETATDPVAVAERLLGTPYLWGGNSSQGIDCSGLVQGALLLCGCDCPADSDLQQAALGDTLPPDTEPRRGDLLFWKGHVAWVAGPDLLLHANAHHMAVAFEPLVAAVARIEANGDGPVTRHARLPLT